MSSRSTIALLALGLAVAAIYFLSGFSERTPDGAPVDAYPPGRWTEAEAVTAAEKARLLSLPYAAAKVEPTASNSGVVVHDSEQARSGLNLYCSGHAAEALLIDMDGRPLHRWSYDAADAFPQQASGQDSLFFRRVALLPDGDLLALYQGIGLIKLDRRSKLLWKLPVAGFNDFFVESDGRILLITREARVIPEINPDAEVLEDFVLEVLPDGVAMGRSSLLAALRQPEWIDRLSTMADRGDILHANTVTRIGTDAGAGAGPFAAGNLLVSLREVDLLATLDPTGSRVLWAQRGDWKRQHEPVLTADGELLLFDNQGAANGGARAVAISPDSGSQRSVYGDGEGERLFSPEGGTVARLDNDNILITASESGRAIEVSPSGELVWEFLSPHRAGPGDRLVATLWEMQRLDPAVAPWLDSP